MKIFRSRKALSPVVASIILIAVTVAVSIAVAAWMGALTFNFMATEQLKITNVQFGSNNTITVIMQNTGTTPITIVSINVNNLAAGPFWTGSTTVGANNETQISFSYQYSNGYQYEIEARSQKGNQFTYSVTSPNS
jgi:flagellin-like protein